MDTVIQVTTRGSPPQRFTNFERNIVVKTIKGPAIFLAQFASDQPPFDSLEHMARWAADLGYVAVQIPTWDGRLFDLERAAESDEYCEEVKGILSAHGLQVSELSTHLQGSWWRYTRPTTQPSTTSRLPSCRDGRRSGRPGPYIKFDVEPRPRDDSVAGRWQPSRAGSHGLSFIHGRRDLPA